MSHNERADELVDEVAVLHFPPALSYVVCGGYIICVLYNIVL